MYNRIKEQMKKSHISVEELAQELQITNVLLQKKFTGEIPFTLDEAWHIKKQLKMEESLEILFDIFLNEM